MSRHRNVRAINVSDEYEGYDDVYGHSVEDDYCISPSDAAQFMYDRARQPQMSAFFNEENNITEEDESELENVEQKSATGHLVLSDIDEAKMCSCLDEIRNIMGETIPENILREKILKNGFEMAKILDDIFNMPFTNVPDDPKPQRERRERNRDKDDSSFSGSSTYDSSESGEESIEKFSIHNKNVSRPSFDTQQYHQPSNINVQFKKLGLTFQEDSKPEDQDETVPIGEDNLFSSLSALAELHKSSKSNSEDSKLTIFPLATSGEGNDQQASSLSELACSHLKSAKSFSGKRYGQREIDNNKHEPVNDKEEFSSLASLANFRLKESVHIGGKTTSQSSLRFTNLTCNFNDLVSTDCGEAMEIASSALISKSISSTHLVNSSQLMDDQLIKNSRVSKVSREIGRCSVGINIPDVSSGVDHLENEDWIIDLSSALKSPGKTIQDTVDGYEQSSKHSESSDNLKLLQNLPCQMSSKHILNDSIRSVKRKSSVFGKILCKKWVNRSKLISWTYDSFNQNSFKFDNPSPDDIVKKHLGIR